MGLLPPLANATSYFVARELRRALSERDYWQQRLNEDMPTSDLERCARNYVTADERVRKAVEVVRES